MFERRFALLGWSLCLVLGAAPALAQQPTEPPVLVPPSAEPPVPDLLGAPKPATNQPPTAPNPAAAQPPAAPKPAASQPSGEDELDVRWTQPYAEAVQKKADLLIVDRPLDDSLTRLELVRWLTSAFSLRPTGKKTAAIKDVPKGTPDYLNVQAVVQSGVMPLMNGNQFKPNGDLTRLEALAIFDRALKLSALPKPAADGWLGLYEDVANVPATGRDFIAAAAQAGLIVNAPNPRRIGPDDVITRGEGAVLLHQALVYQKKIAAIEPPVAQLKIERPTIADIQVQPAGQVKAGDTVTVLAKGTPGAQAKFDFGDFAKDVPMQETSPGSYSGTYKVGDKDAAANPPVAVRLERSGFDTRVQKIAKLQVGDPRLAQEPEDDLDAPPPPRVAARGSDPDLDEPPPRDPYAGRSPYGATSPYGGSAASPYGGYPGTRSPGAYNDPFRGRSPYGDPYSNRNPYADPYGGRSPYGSTQPGLDPDGFPLPPNRAGAGGRAPTTARLPRPRGGDLFNPVAPFDPAQRQQTIRIQQANYEPTNRPLMTGDVLTVSLAGDVGGRATFRILGYTAPIPMKEVSPGVYEGKVQIGRNINVPGGMIEVALERSGQRISRTLDAPVNISSTP